MDRNSMKAWSLILQLSLSMLVPIILCLFIGIWLDKLFGTEPIFMIFFIIMGIGAGFRSVYMLTKDFFSSKDTYVDTKKYRGKSRGDENGD